MHHRGGGVGHTTQAKVDDHFLIEIPAQTSNATEERTDEDEVTHALTMDEINKLADLPNDLNGESDPGSEMDFDDDDDELDDEASEAGGAEDLGGL